MRSIVKERSFKFSVRIIRLYTYLTKDKKEYVLSKQLLRCGTSIGANIREALNGESKMDFVHKFAIAQKECDETLYWIELLKEAEILNQKEFDSIYPEAEELLKMIRSIIMKTKTNLKKGSAT
ncbi:MAG: four helix bundle protein [Candidatus Kapabacteria bacterium]|nr:four helix bundle protein [Candidatus Kapabacteria bacterium]